MYAHSSQARTEMERSRYDYFAAIRIFNRILVDPFTGLHINQARNIVRQNSGFINTFTVFEAQARRLALTPDFGGIVTNRNMPELHGGGATGFFWHYHVNNFPNSHLWFLVRGG